MYEQELLAARKACHAAGGIQLAYRHKIKNIEIKADRSPVTLVDRSCEQVLIDILNSRFPDDGFLGEELGEQKGRSGRRWIIDPLDGTRPYIKDIPTYSVLLALEDAGEPVVGIIYLPELSITCWAHKDGGAFCNEKPVRVSAAPTLKAAYGSGLGFLDRFESAEGRALIRCMRSWDYAYGFMDAFSYVCVARGGLDLCVNLLDKPWDCAAAACIVTEAGGRYSDIRGNRSIHNGSFVATNGRLHDETLRFFND
jgi:histidinol phosphatase-like enzyme (inositol monophosphatase family)